MELPRRTRGDEYLSEGRYASLAGQLRSNTAHADITCLVVYAFDSRTRLLPFIYFDTKMIPAGARAIGAALFDAGFTKTRVVLQQWNPNFRPSQALIDGRPPDVLLVSSMQIHTERAAELIVDAHGLGSARPLILAGGPKVIYEPQDMFTLGDGTQGADVAVTGEEPILLELLEVVSGCRGAGETMRTAFVRARREGLLNKVPGLVYEDPAPPDGRRLIHTGIQRLLRNLDELASPVHGYRLLERPSRKAGLASKPLADNEVYRHAWLSSLVTTRGCKFACEYCPIPAYNQRTFRTKSPGRTVQEVAELNEIFGYRYFFGTDDNFFNSRSSVQAFFEAFDKAQYKGKFVRRNFRFATEATEFDVYRNRDLLPLAKRAGLLAIWFGIEDMTADLVNKGQTPLKTKELFSEMLSLGLLPMAMMMHHDGQPLLSRGNLKGLLNQAKFLHDCGAISYQCTILSPSTGSRSFESTYESGNLIKSVNGVDVPMSHRDANRVVCTNDPKPWRRQLNVLAAYASFYNPINLVRSLFEPRLVRDRRFGFQLFGNLAMPRTAWEMLKWAGRLATGKVEYYNAAPVYPLPVHWVNEPGGRQPTSKPPPILNLRPELASHSA